MDASSFYECIKENKLFSPNEDADAILVLDREFEKRLQAAKDASVQGVKKDAFLFFQGALMGMMIAYRQTKHHYLEEARKQQVDLDPTEH